MAASLGYQGQLGISASNPVDARFDFHRESVACNEEFFDTSGLRGTRSHLITRVRQSIRRIGGQIEVQPTAGEMALLIPWIMGAAASGTTYALAETLLSRYVTIDRGAKVFTYDGCKVDRARFYCSGPGQPLGISIDVVGIDETIGNSGTFPSLTLDTTAPFMWHDCVLSVAGSNYSSQSFECVIDNHLDKDRFFNSQTITAINPLDRTVSTNFLLPYGDATAAYATGAGGVAVTATFTNGNVSILFSFVKVAFPRKPITIPGRREIFLPLQGIAYASASTESLIITLDSTP